WACAPPSRRRSQDPATADSCRAAPDCRDLRDRSSIALQIICAFLAAEIAVHRLGDTVFDGGAVADHAAVGPLDAAIVGAKFGIGQQNEAAGIASLLGELREMRARFVHELLRQADGDMRRGTELAENLDDELLDFGERFALDQRGGEFLRDGYRDLDRFG